MPVTQEKLKGSLEFGVDAETYNTLRTMVEAKKEELKDLQALMVKEQGYLKKLRDDQVKERQAVEQELRLRRQEFEREIAGERYRLKALQDNLDQVASDISLQRKELDVLTANAEGIRRERDQAVQERITMEQQRVRAEEVKQQSEQTLQQLHAAQSQFESVQKATEEARTKAEQQDRINIAKQEELEAREKAIKLDLDQVTILRQELDPKLEQLTIREVQVQDSLKRVETLQRECAEQKTELAQARTDLEGLAQKLEAKNQQLNEWELRLKQMQSNLYLKIQQAKAKGVDVEVPPTDA